VTPIDSETFLVTEFVNLKIKPVQCFRGTHRSRVHVFIEVGAHTHMSIYVYIVFLKKKIMFAQKPFFCCNVN
jgi:hypothetical protein